MVSRYFCNILILLFGIAMPAVAADITVQVDRNPVHVNESFQLIFEAIGSVDDDPNFAPLRKNFEILQQNQSSNFSIINGKTTRSKKWLLMVMAKKEGTFAIPAIAFGKDRSQESAITVKPAVKASADQQGELFLEVEAKPQNAFVQGQIILTVRLLTAINIAQYAIDDPNITSLDTVIEKLGDDKQYRSNRGQREYIVLERNYAIFPQERGTLHINPLIAQAEVVVGSNSSRMDFFRRNTRTRRIQSPAIDIEVAGIPPNYQGIWLPANGLQLVEEWPQDPPEFTVGEPVTWTISIGAQGLTSAQLPELAPDDIAGLKQYPDQPILQDQKKDDTIIGVRQEKIALIPPHAGDYTLPAIEVPWWNTKTGKMEIARIPARQISVAQGEKTTPQLSIPIAGIKDGSQTKTSGTDITQQLKSTEKPASYWPWLSLLLGVGWLFTGAGWLLSKKSRNDAKVAEKNASVKLRQAKNALKKASSKKDAQATKEALLAWGKCIFPHSPPHSLGELGELTGDQMKTELDLLNTTLYAGQSVDWSGDRIWSLAQKFTPQNTGTGQLRGNALEPMKR